MDIAKVNKCEVGIVLGILGMIVGVPLFFEELYPFSRYPMYSDTPQYDVSYRVIDNMGNPLEPIALGLNATYNGNPPKVGYGFHSPPTLTDVEPPPNGSEVIRWVEVHLAAMNNGPVWVDVFRVVATTKDERSFGVTEKAMWRVLNPRYNRIATP